MAETEQKDTVAETQIERKDEPKPEVEQPPVDVQPELQSMRSVVLTGHGGYNKIKVEKYARPKPMLGQVIVKVHACGLNFSDTLARQGHYSLAPKTPYVMGNECSGVVEELGEDVTGIEVGSRVCCLGACGMWSEYASVQAKNCFVMPDAMTFEEGAALPVTYLTAHLMLFYVGNLNRRKSVLIHMAAGGVGTAVTQLCKSVEGVTVFGTASKSKHETIVGHGVTHAIDYRNHDYVQEVKKISPDGVDLVLDPLGGPETKRCYDLVKPLGCLITYGNASEPKGMFSKLFSGASFVPNKLIFENRSVAGFHLGRLAGSHEVINDAMKDIMRLYDEGIVKPVIDSVYALEEVGKAMQKMHDRQNIGKLLFSPMKEAEPEPVEEPHKNKKKAKKGEEAEAKEEAPAAEGKEEDKPEEGTAAEAAAETPKADEEKKEEEPKKDEEPKKEEEAKKEEEVKKEEEAKKEEEEPKKDEEPKKAEEPKKEEEPKTEAEPKKEEEEEKKEAEEVKTEDAATEDAATESKPEEETKTGEDSAL